MISQEALVERQNLRIDHNQEIFTPAKPTNGGAGM
jgi:hypothetical protein